MRFHKKTILIFTLFFLISCGEKTVTSTILNNSKKEITVKVKIDNDAVDKKRKEYLEKAHPFNKENVKDYEFKIAPSESYLFDVTMFTEPDFYDIKEIEIYSGDTLILKSKRNQLKILFSNANNPGYLIIN